jgi:hypothetical protein
MSSPYKMNVIGFTRMVLIRNIIKLPVQKTLESGANTL